mmetsp:Transcript_29257/g.68772  ORF Transcript_29257/g.68772 Transcript_29257/m.68772 type:complete len:273 (+) Transcript_29257:67-885(+)
MSHTTPLINGASDVLTSFFAPDTDLPPETAFRNIIFMLAHFGFFIVNVINAFVLIFFEGFGTGRLRSNRASQLSLAAQLSQLFSCYTSIRRYNVKNEYGRDARIGTIAGIAGFFFVNMSYLHLYYRNGAKNIWRGILFWILVCVFVVWETLAKWNEVHFHTFRILIGFSALSNIYILHKSREDLLRGMFSNELVPSAVVARIWISSVILLGISFACAFSLIPALTYPGTGIIYSVCMVNSMLTGRMSFAKGTKAKQIARLDTLNRGDRQFTI